MPAYAIFIRNQLHDRDGIVAYRQLAQAARGAHPLNFLAVYGEVEALEGEPAERVVLIEFPDMDAARAWYHSPEYQLAKVQRMKSADYRAILFDGGPHTLIDQGDL